MRKTKERAALLFLLYCGLGLLAACGIVMQMVGLDPDPPEGYSPRYIKSVRPFASQNLHNVALELSRIEPVSASRLKIYAHLIDTNGAYLSGAAAERYKKIWCEVIDSSEFERRRISSFRLREYNKTDRKPQAIALVMDFSGSMGEERAGAVQEAANNFISHHIKQPEDAVALIKYDHVANVECPLTTDKNELLRRLHSKQGLQGYGGHTATFTAIAKGVKETMNSGDDKQRVVIVFTDGDDNASWLTKEDVIRFARETNTIVCAIDYGYAVGEKSMEEIARKTYGTYNHIYRRAEFDLVFKDIYRRFEDYYLIEFDQTDFGAHYVYLKLCLPEIKEKPIEAKSSYDNTPYPGSVSLLNVFFDSDLVASRLALPLFQARESSLPNYDT